MIIKFASIETENIWHCEVSQRFPRQLQQIALRKLFMLDKAQSPNELGFLSVNRPRTLENHRKVLQSIRINEQWRIRFVWTDDGPTAVEIFDSHNEHNHG